MSEAVKTLIFVAIAAVVGVGAYVTRPATVVESTEEEVNRPLFEEFQDPLQAQSMEITRYDSERAEIRTFQVANTPEGWQINSKGGYPADATEQMSKAATALVDLNVLRIVSDSPGQHAEYGVVEPTTSAASATAEGVGQLVTIRGASDKVLANLIIGVADKEKTELRYVRIPGRDRVYLVNLDPSVFSTEFADWIEKDLLKLNPFDVQALRFRNYTLQIAGGSGLFLPEMDATVRYDSESSEWSLVELKEPPEDQPTQLVQTSLPDGHQLNSEQLNTLRNSLDDLTIVDVYRKPQRLAAALQSDQSLQQLTAEDLPTLVRNGFYPTTLPGDSEAQIVGINGELVIETQDAIRYRLLFGGEQLGGEDRNQKQRFLFVQTELVEDMLPQPELQEVPEIDEGEDQDVEAQAQRREEILQANDRAMNEYRERLNNARRKMFELNARFAQWYYVVAEEDFEKILLSRDQLSVDPNQVESTAGQSNLPGLPGMNEMVLPDIATPPVQPEVRPATSMQDEESADDDTEKPADDTDNAAQQQPAEETPSQPAEDPEPVSELQDSESAPAEAASPTPEPEAEESTSAEQTPNSPESPADGSTSEAAAEESEPSAS